jgi:hypothetical protein
VVVAWRGLEAVGELFERRGRACQATHTSANQLSSRQRRCHNSVTNAEPLRVLSHDSSETLQQFWLSPENRRTQQLSYADYKSWRTDEGPAGV